MATIKAPKVSRELFGGVFDIDGAGLYPGLELINFVVCNPDGMLPGANNATLLRVAHDFARRLVHDDTFTEQQRRSVLLDAHSEDAVSRLLRSLELELPNLTKAKSWERTHFFPFTRSLVHWDARLRHDKVTLERRYLRGAGAFAYCVLTTDANQERLNRIRRGFEDLYPAGDSSPLEMLAKTLSDAGFCDDNPATDEIYRQIILPDPELAELYRGGVSNILSHLQSSVVDRVRALMHWTGLWTVLLMTSSASGVVSGKRIGLLTDCAGVHPQLRRAAQRSYKQHVRNIEEASNIKASELGGELSDQQLGKIRGYFGNTAVSCGLGNSWKGRRHLTLKLEAIDALVMAGIPQDGEMEFDRFISDWVYHRCRIVVGREAAQCEQLLTDLDSTIFEENERALSEQMHMAGMLRMYSDATRMVSCGSHR